MSQSIVLKSFAELATALGVDETLEMQPSAASEEIEASRCVELTSDLAGLLTKLEAASAMLATVARQDQEARTLALRDLAQYDALVAQQRQAEQAQARAHQVRSEAEALAADAFATEACTAAGKVAELARKAEDAAAALAQQRQVEAEHLVTRLDLERLLAERRRQEEAEKAKAAEAERARRLSDALARARSALDAGQCQEARELLALVCSENPDNPEIASLMSIMAQRELTVKVTAAEEALWAARREYRRDPAAAVQRLQSLDVAGLPDPLARQIFGAWAGACARLCRESEIAAPLRYAPEPGRGVVIARESPDGDYVVVSALGMGRSWQNGTRVSARQVERARPLR